MPAWTEPIGTVYGAVYDFTVQRERLARPAARALWGADIGPIYDDIRALGELPAGTSVLDAPCGGGLALRGLRPGQDVRYVSADLSTVMLTRARRRAADLGLSGVEFVEANIEALPFADGEFDVAVCFNGLHVLPNPAVAVRELARCLTPGGRLVGDTIVNGVSRRFDRTFAIMRRTGLLGPTGTAEELRGWFADAGLTAIRLTRSGPIVHFTGVRE